MVSLTLSKGKVHGVRPADVVSTIAYHANVPGGEIGRIHIEDQHTLVDAPERFVAQVLAPRRLPHLAGSVRRGAGLTSIIYDQRCTGAGNNRIVLGLNP